MVKYVDFEFIERKAINYEGEYAFMKRDNTLIISVASPLIFI